METKKIEIKIKRKLTNVTYNGKTTTHRTVFLNNLSFKDAINYLTEIK